jgi:hypothetical protein
MSRRHNDRSSNDGEWPFKLTRGQGTIVIGHESFGARRGSHG